MNRLRGLLLTLATLSLLPGAVPTSLAKEQHKPMKAFRDVFWFLTSQNCK